MAWLPTSWMFGLFLLLAPAGTALDAGGASAESDSAGSAGMPAHQALATGLGRTAPAAPLLPPAIAAWTLPVVLPGPPMQVHGQATLSSLTFYTPLGDIDADGQADVLVETFDPQALTTSYAALAGPDLQQVLWSLPAEAGRVVQAAADVTGDGVLDPVAVTAIFDDVSDETQGAAGAGVRQVQATGQFVLQTIDGDRGLTRFTRDLDISLDATVAGATGAAGQVGPQAQQVTQAAGSAIATASGGARTLEHTVQMAQSSLPLPLMPPALPIPLPLSATNVEADLVIEIVGAAGSVTGSIELSDPNVNPLAVAAPDVDLDGVADTLVLVANKTSPVEEASVVVPIVMSYAGDAADQVWVTALDQIQGVPMLIPRLGDLDADGLLETAVLGLQAAGAQAQDPLAAGSVLSILSGATGQVLGSAQAVGSVTSAVPFGALPGVPADAILLVTESTGSLDIAAAGADLEAIWSISLDPSAVPLNQVVDQATHELQGFADWTGDGVADVAVAVQGAAGTVEAALYDGVSGTLSWTASLPGAIGIVPVPDLAGPAGTALAAIQTIPASGDTVLTLLRATDGAVVWNATLLAAEAAQAISPAMDLLGDIQALGDLDGDGIGDFALRVELRTDGESEASAELHGDNVSVSDDTVAQTLLVSGRDGDVLASTTDANLTSEAAATVPQLDLSDVEPGPAYLASTEADEGRDSPGLGALAFLAALALAAVAARRRT